jgi:2-methylcitrate dehydratase PrpD
MVTERHATEKLVDFAYGTGFGMLPEDVVAIGRSLVIDSIGCALGGHGVTKGAVAVELAADFGGGSDATIVGGGRSSLLSAAFANGELMNAIDMDAVLIPGHISPYVVPAVLAAAEKGAVSGRELIRGVVLSHEIAARVGGAFAGLRTNVVENGMKKAVLTPATGYGTTIVGGATGAGLLLGLDRTQLLNCFGAAGYMAPVPALGKYLRLPYSPTAKYTSAGWVAMGSVLAARLAAAGYSGDREVLDGEFGFWRMCASPTCDWDFMLGGLGSTWQIRNNEIKPYPSFRMGHPGIEAFLKLLEAEHIAVDAIERVDVYVDPVAASPIYLNREIKSHSDAFISWSHVMGVAPFYPPGPAWQSKEAIADPRVKSLSDKVFVQGKWDRTAEADGASSTLVIHPVEVIVQAGGKRHEANLMPYPKGHPKRPLSESEFDAKFLHNAGWRFSEAHAREVLVVLKSLVDLDDLRPVFAAIEAR